MPPTVLSGLSYAHSFEARGALVPVRHCQLSQLAIVFRPAAGLTTYTSLDYVEPPNFPTLI